MISTQRTLVCVIQKRSLAILTFALVLSNSTILYANTPPVVSNMTASQRADGTFLVDVYYDVSDADGDLLTISLEVSDDGGSTWDVDCQLLSGDVGTGIIPGIGKHIVWDLGSEHPDVIDMYKFKVVADDGVVVDVTTGLIAYYPFSGSALDLSGNGNNGTVYGATLSEDRFGNPNSAYYFDGNDYINIGQLPQLEGAQGITVSCWVKRTSSNRYDGFVGKWYTTPAYTRNVFLLYNGENGYAGYCNSSGFINKGAFVVSCRNTNDGASGVSGTSIIQPNTWVHIVGVWSSDDGRSAIYKNGLLDNERIEAQSMNQTLPYNTSHPAMIGNWGYLWGSSYYMIGSIDDVRIYNRALTETEINHLYNNDE